MRAKTIRLTVECPFCHTAYTFKSEGKKDSWNGKSALHTACKKAEKEMMTCGKIVEPNTPTHK